jgi:hypothetical protein
MATVDFGDPAKGTYVLTLSQGGDTISRAIPVEALAQAVSPQAIVQTEAAAMLRELVLHRRRTTGGE